MSFVEPYFCSKVLVSLAVLHEVDFFLPNVLVDHLTGEEHETFVEFHVDGRRVATYRKLRKESSRVPKKKSEIEKEKKSRKQKF